MLTNLTTDRSALVALYNATSGEQWYRSGVIGTGVNWLNFSTSVCEWNGVSCGNSSGSVRVRSLQLPGLSQTTKINGTFPTELGLLDQLTELCGHRLQPKSRMMRLTRCCCYRNAESSPPPPSRRCPAACSPRASASPGTAC